MFQSIKNARFHSLPRVAARFVLALGQRFQMPIGHSATFRDGQSLELCKLSRMSSNISSERIREFRSNWLTPLNALRRTRYRHRFSA
jgi:hypothetical protein